VCTELSDDILRKCIQGIQDRHPRLSADVKKFPEIMEIVQTTFDEAMARTNYCDDMNTKEFAMEWINRHRLACGLLPNTFAPSIEDRISR
jgi:hypothetical protein